MADVGRYLEDHVVARLARIAGALPAELDVDLNQADRERAARFRFAEDRTRFLWGRTLLARLLSRCLGIPSGVAGLSCTAQGRPVLADRPDVHFSISHSAELVAVALAIGTQVGIDVEYMPRELQLDPLAERIFSADDLAIFRALPAAASRAAFFHAWTGKEAVLKARGVGLFGGIREVSVQARGGKPSVRVLDEPAADGAEWQLHPLPVPVDYAGHIAWNDVRKTLDFREVRLEELY